jgi:hypothetical protein
MKAFRGTAMAMLALVLVGAMVWLFKPTMFAPSPVGNPQLFRFEKHELVRVEVQRPEGDNVVLVEQDGQWVIEATGHEAGRSMVNRVKHQLHDLTARASVVEEPDNLSLYGLGENAIHVVLSLREGKQVAFDVGDPNPTSVSYYIQPKNSDRIYTVKKAAVDYYSLTLDEFRERRFASFDSKDVTGITAVLRLPEANHTLIMTREGERKWAMSSPIEMDADHDQARRLMGRVSAMKAVRFEPLQSGDVSRYGLDEPRADITIRFASRDPLRIRVGDAAPVERKHDVLAYVLMDEGDTVFVARSGMLEEFATDPKTFRNRRVVQLRSEDVVSVDVALRAGSGNDLSGEGHVRYAAEQWVWHDGVPVSGSTPKRVARRFAELEVDNFIAEAPFELATFELDEPIARIELRDRDDNLRVVRIGGEGEPMTDPEGHEHARYYAMVEGEQSVYLVNKGVLEVVRDLVREASRKAAKDAEKASRQERIETAPGSEAP